MRKLLILEVIAKVLQCYPSAPLRVRLYVRSLSGAEMNRTFVITSLLLTFLSTFPLYSETSLSGKLGNMLIERVGNPFIVTDNIVVPEGKTLTIAEGAILLFKPFTGLIVEGSLVVEGGLANPVIFSTENDPKYNPSSKQLPNPFDWNGILITPNAKHVKLSNFVLEYSVYGVKSQKEEFIISNGTFTRNGQFHVTVNDAIKNVVDDIPFNFGKEFDGKNRNTRASAKATWRKPVGIGLGVAGLAAIGAGSYFLYLSNDYNSKYKTTEIQTQMDDFYDKKNTSLTVAGICAVGGLVSSACGIALMLWKPHAGKVQKVTIAPVFGCSNGILLTLNY